MNNLFKNLNDMQAEAVMATEGKVRVIAGAGSGKTRVLAHRYAYLVNEVGIDPGNILCMTFTNKAAREMKNRIAKLVHRAHVNDFTCTIHGFCVKFLRKDIHRLGYPKTFTIIDEEDAKTLALQVFEEMHIDAKKDTIKEFLDDIRIYKTHLEYIDKIIVPTAKLEAKDIDETVRYIQLQLRNYALDFNDIINFSLYIMHNFPEALSYWQDKLNYIQVDEVQDCNEKDWKIINYLMGGYGNLFIVGDSDQAIYEWRGAMPDYFNQFVADKDVMLTQNYRSTPNILEVANSIIAHNENRIPKDLFTVRPSEKIVVHHHAKSEYDECKWIAEQIRDMSKEGVPYSSFAILYRASYLSRSIEQELIKKQIKYVVWGGLRFFERKEIKDCLAYLRLIANRNDDIAFRRIINVPKRSFGKISQSRLQELAEAEGMSLFDTLVKYKNDEAFASKTAVMQFMQFIDDYHGYSSFTDIGDLLDSVLRDSGLEAMYRKEGDQDRLDNIEELKQSIKGYEEQNMDSEFLTLESYLQEIALYTNADYKEDGETVKLMTIHQAKGLEFPYVFIIGLSEGIFPNYRSIRSRNKRAEEEERRLMYVAVTRAEKGLFLTESEGYNFMTRQEKFPSRYILEVSEGLLHLDGDINKELMNNLLAGTKRQMEEMNYEVSPNDFEVGNKVVNKFFGIGTILEKGSDNSYKVQFEAGNRFMQGMHLRHWSSAEPAFVPDKSLKPQAQRLSTDYSIGDVVEHQRFGIGYISQVEDSGDKTKLTIVFNGGETKQLLAKFAKLTIKDKVTKQ